MHALSLLFILALAACSARENIPDNGLVGEGTLLAITRAGSSSQYLIIDYLDASGNVSGDAFDTAYRQTGGDNSAQDHVRFNGVPFPGDQIRITKLRSHEYVVDKLE